MPAQGRARFEKKFRLRVAAEFSQVFGYRRAVRGERFRLSYKPNSLGTARLGFVVARKHVRRAVWRNRIRRVAREVFRLERENLPHLDLVLRVTSSLRDPERTELRTEIAQLLARLPK
ncbi:MAG: ribonuclease P protein component [Rhodocyclaceae bacterium]|nr:ribonuclease P protein component [Rhodocyclaceae bacterium]MBX3669552.1 ribonuclease P protein component [Rhodocyclaceae bacterium]